MKWITILFHRLSINILNEVDFIILSKAESIISIAIDFITTCEVLFYHPGRSRGMLLPPQILRLRSE